MVFRKSKVLFFCKSILKQNYIPKNLCGWEGFATIMGWGLFLSVVGKVPVIPLDANCMVVKRAYVLG